MTTFKKLSIPQKILVSFITGFIIFTGFVLFLFLQLFILLKQRKRPTASLKEPIEGEVIRNSVKYGIEDDSLRK